MGMSMGYVTIKSAMVEGVRKLKEVKLIEGSLVTTAMNRLCFVHDVKADGMKQKDFAMDLDEIQTWNMKHMLLQALYSSLDNAMNGNPEGMAGFVDQAIQDFHTAFLGYLPKWIALIKAGETHETMANRSVAVKDLMSSEDRNGLIAILKTLTGDSGTSKGAATSSSAQHEPHHLHSWMTGFKLVG
jgi:hypothetical protein